MYRILLASVMSFLFVIANPLATAQAMSNDSGSPWAPDKPKDDKKKKNTKKKDGDQKDNTNKHREGALDVDREYALASQDIAEARYARALPRLRRIVALAPRHADAWNMIGFASRKIGELKVSWKAYQTALSIAPEHRGAHEYLGEWYLQSHDVAGAVEQYRTLDRLCAGPCREKTALEKAIVRYSLAQLNENVTNELRRRLASAGFADGKLVEALKAFQLANGIDEVGLFEKTRRALKI